MLNLKASFLARTALALVAFGLVAGSTVVSASAPATYPIPRSGRLVGPPTVVHNGVASYQLYVTFTDGSIASYIGAPATFSASSTHGSAGSFVSSSSTYAAPGTANPFVVLTGKYSTAAASLTVNRVIAVN
jgi:hypothetical protein